MRCGRILVAGATGRVRGAAVRHLLDASIEVRALARSAAKGAILRSRGAKPVVGDVTIVVLHPPLSVLRLAGRFSS